MKDLTYWQKAELIRYRHEDQAKLLESISTAALKIFSGFLTLHLAFASFLTQVSLSAGAKWGCVLLEIALCGTCTGMLLNNQRRRREAAKTIQNCNEFLGFSKKGAYLTDREINATSKFWPWLPFYIIGIWLTFVGICLILISGEKMHPQPDFETSGTRQEQLLGVEAASIKINIIPAVKVTIYKK